MILTVDVGNSNIVLGAVDGSDIRFEAAFVLMQRKHLMNTALI